MNGRGLDGLRKCGLQHAKRDDDADLIDICYKALSSDGSTKAHVPQFLELPNHYISILCIQTKTLH